MTEKPSIGATIGRRAGFALVALTTSSLTFAADRTEVAFPDLSYPESITSTSDGTLYAGNITLGGVFKVKPGADAAERWIEPGANDTMTILGVLADEKSNTLWVCSNNFSAIGVQPPAGVKPVALKAFDLATGAAKGSYPLPGKGSICNDIAVGVDGAVYVTDSLQPHVLVLRPGAASLEVWSESSQFAGQGAQLDGIAISGAAMYVNTFSGGKLFRIEMSGGHAGKVTELKTSLQLDHPDGMRALGPRSLVLAEGGGRFDLVSLDGDSAKIDVLKQGIKGPCAVTLVGSTAWVVEGQQTTLFNPKSGKPGPFKAYAVQVPKI